MYFKFSVGHPVIHVGDVFKDKKTVCARRPYKMYYRSSREAV
jgi:hypothetical protein